jgi:hypothetical protein
LAFGKNMNQQLHALTTVLAVLASVLSALGELPEPDPFAVDAPHAEPPSNPNHLEPVPAYAPDGYDQAVFRSLIGDDPGELWMVGKPSFSPEYAIIIRHEIKYRKSDDPFEHKIQSEKWIVEHTEAKKQIWKMKKVGGDRLVSGFHVTYSVMDIHVTKDVIRHRAEVTEEFSSLMFDAWNSVLRKTRYTDIDYRGLDGSTFQFYCHGNLFGEIWSPESGLPSMLTELGRKLAEVARAEAKDRSKLLAECVGLAKNIKAETQKAEQLGAGQQATKPAEKVPAEVQPSTPTPKDGPR